MPSPGYWQRAFVDRLFARAGLGPVISCESDEPAAMPSLVAAGLGMALLPAMSRRDNPHPGVAWLHLDDPDSRRTLRLVWRRGVYLSAAARAFRDAALAWFLESARPT
jgi:DNA-binding transcriptional LysR family regulator